MSDGTALPDDRYDVMVLDAVPTDEEGALHLTLTTLDGPWRGHVVELVARGLPGDPLELLGTPATLVVEGGRPRLEPG